MKINNFVIAGAIFALLAVALTMASINLVSESIATNYSGGETVRGKVYLTLANEETSTPVTSNFLGNITLLNLIKLQGNVIQGVNYNCNTPDCEGTYVSDGLVNGLLLSQGSSGFAGFVVSGTGVSITDAKLSLQSNALASCTPQIIVDVLADGEDLLTNSKTNGESCGIRYSGCYNQSNTNEATIISNSEYCERLTLPPSSAFIVGGEIRNGTTVANLTMKLYDVTEGGVAGSCLLPKHNQSIQELNCRINYTAPESREYYVCITSSNSGGYKIGWETSAPNCGTAQGFGVLNSDFDLFAESTKYSASPNFVINDTTYEQSFNIELDAVLDGYVSDKYNRECQPNPCVIPISFSGGNQYAELSGASIDYETVGVPATSSEIHRVSYTDALMSGTNVSIDISKANFMIPVDSSENKFKLLIDNNIVFQKDITVRKGFLFDVEPKFAAFGQNVQFNILSNRTITNSTWSFGDGNAVQQVNGGSIAHAFTQKNNSNFLINVSAFDSTGLYANKQFNIFVGDPRVIANQTIADYKLRVDNLTAQINSLPIWLVQKLQEIVKVGEISSRLNTIEADYRASTSESDYREVMLDLIELKMPKEIILADSGQNLPLSVGYASINPNYIERIDNKDVADNSDLTAKIVAWMNTYFNAEISSQKVTLARDYDSEVIATKFTINTNPNAMQEEEVYLIFGQDIENSGLYKMNYNANSISGIGIDYVEINSGTNEVFEFLVIGDISAQTLGAYIAPPIDALGIEEAPDAFCNLNNICDSNENENICPEDCSRKGIKFSIVSWIILGIAFIVAYIILQEWYKKKYQKHLFPDENNLYNLMNFIYTARRSGLSDGQIHSRLHEQGWDREKISFAFRKISGKRVGMLEIPLLTHIQHKETLAKLSVKQGAPLDARFIKRPSFN